MLISHHTVSVACGAAAVRPLASFGQPNVLVAIDLKDAPSDHKAESLLDRDELSRALAFRQDDDRLRYIASHAALRQILATLLGGKPKDICFRRGQYGKPFIERGVNIPGYFNLSHTKELAVVAVNMTYEVGIDIETIQSIPDAAAIAAIQFSTRENLTLAELPELEKITGFYHCWTQREAVLKLYGWGLMTASTGIEIEADPRKAPRVLAVPNPAIPPKLIALSGINGHLGCLALPPQIHRMICLRW